jgi:hypothetical protein
MSSVQNINAKKFVYSVTHGNLIAVNIRTTESGEFTSLDADMIVTTPVRTSVQFWQKSGNKACLTAAPGSLYVDDACSKVCALRAANSSNSSSSSTSSRRLLAHAPANTTFARFPDNVSAATLRQLGAKTITLQGLVITDPVAGDPRTPWVCAGQPGVDDEWQCTKYDATELALNERCPEGNKYTYKYEVKVVPDCTDLSICFEDESSKCLCKPTCDMAGLDPPGTCNDAGQCCQTLCAGYSRADMFPVPNMPRCGIEVSELYRWCTNELDQRWRFTSDLGQISVQVLEKCDTNAPSKCGCDPTSTEPCKPSPSVSSWRGAAPKPSILGDQEFDGLDTDLDLNAEEKFLLNKRFHLGSLPSPKEEWFSLKVKGPGTALHYPDWHAACIWSTSSRIPPPASPAILSSVVRLSITLCTFSFICFQAPGMQKPLLV